MIIRPFIYLFSLLILFSNISVLAKSDPIMRVKIDAKSLEEKKGLLSEDGAENLIAAAYDQGLLSQSSEEFSDPKCIKAKNISSQGGLKTLSLFAILVSEQCIKGEKPGGDFKVSYILKEMQDKQEPYNLDVIKKDPELRKLDMNKAREKGLPGISFHHELISYGGKDGKEHVFGILYAAPGKELHALVENAADNKKNKKDLEILKQANYQVGKALGKMQALFMKPKGEIFGDTLAHSDLHDRNVFVDKEEVTFIDNESFIHSIKEKKPVWVDMLRFLNPAYNPKPAKRHPKAFSAREWSEVSVKPFFQGYVDAYPEAKREKVLQALKKMFLKDSPATDKIKEQYGEKHLNNVRNEYLIPAFSGIN